MNSARRKLQDWLGKKGIEVRKLPADPFRPVPVFHLAVQMLMQRNGPALSFVQIGANDGMFGDPLRRYIVDDGWTGVLVEPQPHVFEQLRANYAAQAERLTFANVAISPTPGELSLYLPATRPGESAEIWRSSVVSSDPHVTARQLKVPVEALKKVTVPAITLDQLFERHGVTRCDVLQIDVEGLDWGVLSSLSLDRHQPSIIQFESGHLSRADCTAAGRYLSAHGYDIYWGGHHGDALALRHGEVIRLSKSDTDREI